MSRNTLLGRVAVVVILGGIALYAATRPMTAVAPGTTATSTLPVLSPYAEHGPYYDIAVNYPTTTPLAAAADSAARASMRAWAAGEIAQFKTQGNFDHLTQNDIHMMGYDQGRKETLQIEYLIASSPHTVSYIYTEYLDTLGAHPNTFFKTFTYDKANGKQLALSDVFSGDYLAKLSSLASAYLTQSLGTQAVPQMIAAGTAPDAANFGNFFFDNGTFAILFQPYQVAAYASGPQTVRLSASSLSGFLNPRYP